MGIQGEKQKVSPVTVEHWKKKFDKAIQILLKSGIKSENLIEKIKIENEKNNKT
jgi:hypothetical protein